MRSIFTVIAQRQREAVDRRSQAQIRVLTSMGLPAQIAKSAIRFSLSRNTTMEEINRTIEIVSEVVRRLRPH